jgi:hypothetical protein
MEGGCRLAVLKGTTFMDPQVIADTARYLNSDLAAKRHCLRVHLILAHSSGLLVVG